MKNLKIKDIKTLETLSVDDMEQVVGGRGRRWSKFRDRRFNCGEVITTQSVVIDNSGSMEEEQEGLASRLNPLLSYISQDDF